MEEQENNITKEKLKEEEVKKISAETQTTAQIVRSTRNRVAIQTGGIRNTATASSGSQTEQPLTHEQGNDPMDKENKGTNTDLEVGTIYTRSRKTQTASTGSKAEIFDMTMEPVVDKTIHDLEIAVAAQAEEIDLKHKKIKQMINKHLG
ncbi:MAG: hypothetical protein ACKO96_14955, partial [Flammeovirgaceae bacterium]